MQYCTSAHLRFSAKECQATDVYPFPTITDRPLPIASPRHLPNISSLQPASQQLSRPKAYGLAERFQPLCAAIRGLGREEKQGSPRARHEQIPVSRSYSIAAKLETEHLSDNAPLLAAYPKGQRVTYLYYLGRLLFQHRHLCRVLNPGDEYATSSGPSTICDRWERECVVLRPGV
jgi:hypothetical protein